MFCLSVAFVMKGVYGYKPIGASKRAPPRPSESASTADTSVDLRAHWPNDCNSDGGWLKG